MLSVYKVAKWGARHALPEVGLDGRESARDISELRSLLGAFNEAKKTAGLTIVRMLFTELVLALLAGELVKLRYLAATVRKMQRDARAGASPKSSGFAQVQCGDRDSVMIRCDVRYLVARRGTERNGIERPS